MQHLVIIKLKSDTVLYRSDIKQNIITSGHARRGNQVGQRSGFNKHLKGESRGGGEMKWSIAGLGPEELKATEGVQRE